MGLLALVIDPDTNKLVNIELSECYMIFNNKDRKIVYCHNNGKCYETPQKMYEFDECIEQLEERGLYYTDRGNYIRLDAIEYFDKNRGEVFFEPNPTEASMKGSIARVHYELLAEKIENIVAAKRGITRGHKVTGPVKKNWRIVEA